MVLAAGEASRFGEPKQLADWFGKTLLSHTIDKLKGLSEYLYVCLGAHHDEIVRRIDFKVSVGW